MLVLLVAFRSVLIPLQAAVTNFLTAMAAFGIVTAVFQWGWGISLVGIDTTASTVPIASFVPLMMFAVLFGLSMDYQVFLLSSVDHFRAHGESDSESVRLGLKASARVIAAAALIMMSVFSSFILNGDPVVKQFGVGLASAVALAATMVLMLAPALLTMMGDGPGGCPACWARSCPRSTSRARTSATSRHPPPRPHRQPREPASSAISAARFASDRRYEGSGADRRRSFGARGHASRLAVERPPRTGAPRGGATLATHRSPAVGAATDVKTTGRRGVPCYARPSNSRGISTAGSS